LIENILAALHGRRARTADNKRIHARRRRYAEAPRVPPAVRLSSFLLKQKDVKVSQMPMYNIREA